MLNKIRYIIDILFVSVLLLITEPCNAYEVQYLSDDSLRVMGILEDTGKQNDDVNLILYIACKMLDIPYVAHTLEVNKTEKLVVNLRELDCTTFVENVLALYLCIKQNSNTFATFCHNLCKIRYRSGCEPHYVKRLHYFTDWIADNTEMGFCEEIQSPIPPFSSTQTISVNFMSSHPDKYKMLRENPDYLPYIKDMEKAINGKTYKFIPKSEMNNNDLLKSVIKDGDIIAITTNIGGLDIQHLGFAVWHSDGLHLLNASSIHHKVVEEPMTLYRYLKKQKTMTGVRVVRVPVR
ncbi:MAG: DUF1460 domain-containing protein [Prevotella sp.]|nr:DUF1460 domain-containing protein [Prevotella sp.]